MFQDTREKLRSGDKAVDSTLVGQRPASSMTALLGAMPAPDGIPPREAGRAARPTGWDFARLLHMYDEVELDEGGGMGKMQAGFSRKWQTWMDKAAPHTTPRWLATAFIMLVYCIRVYFINGWYIITYGLGIYALNLLIGFLSPASDPETEGPTLPTSKDDEFRPFVRRLPEFKFWYGLTKAFIIAFVMTFFNIFNIPVFWPILLMYFFTLFFLTMKRQIKHMIKYKYVPFSFGKTKYKSKDGGDGGMRSAD